MMDQEKSKITASQSSTESDDSRTRKAQVNLELESIEEEEEATEKPQNEEEIDRELADLMTAEEYIEKNGQTMVEFEKQMFKDLCYADGLVVCGKGISYEKVLLNLLRVYCDPSCLVLIINSDDFEEKYYTKMLNSNHIHEAANLAAERQKVYLEGGIQFISTRILVVDLLKNRVPIEHITGIFVLRAHEIIESCQEAFALRLYRQKNKTGFIKAFSLSVESFTMGYGHIERIMRNLFVKELYLWPRYHAVIKKCLQPFEPILHELSIPISEKLTRIQNYLLDLMNFQLKEIRRINPSLDMEEITVENCVNRKFQNILHAQLDHVWNQLSSKTKLLVTDLNILRNLMFSAIYGDAVSFYVLLKKYRTQEYVLSSSGWTLLKPAEEVFKLAKERIFNNKDEFQPEPPAKWRVISEILKVEIPSDIKERLKDPNSGIKRNSQIKILILCNDARTCHQLNQLLMQGEERCLFYNAMRNDIPVPKLSERYKIIHGRGLRDAVHIEHVETNARPTSNKPGPSKAPEKSEPLLVKMIKSKKRQLESDSTESVTSEEALLKDEEDVVLSELEKDLQEKDDSEEDFFRNSYVLTMSQRIDGNETFSAADFDTTKTDEFAFETCADLADLDITNIINSFEKPLVFIQTFKSVRNKISTLDHTLMEMKPDYMILYNLNVTAVRQIEIYEARAKRPQDMRLRVFVLMQSKTVEEQAFLTNLRREKRAFELLIETKRKMVIPEYQDGKSEDALTMLRKSQALSTRQAGGQASTSNEPEIITPRIIVDMREFRSDLPCLIHRRGIEVVPLTITIGDYILTPDICVERKSIPDLVGSLGSGRLYSQCIQMTRFYSKPILLIEFDQNKPFHLQKNFNLSTDSATSNQDIVQKLQLLTIHFPKLRIVWSPSPYATAQLFEELKENKDEPNPELAVQLGSDDPTQEFDAIVEKYNTNIHDFLLKLPGISSKNINAVMKKGKNLKNLLKLDEKELTEILGSSKNAKMLWEGFHMIHKPAPATEQRESSYKQYKEKKFRK